MSKRQRDLGAGLSPMDPFGQLETFKAIGYAILGWFSITVEAFLRYDFGERYYSKGNYLVGFFWLNILILIGFFSTLAGGNPMTMIFIWIGYNLFSALHFFRIWARDQIGEPQHSLYSGRSRLEWLAKLIMKGLNPLLAALSRLLGAIILPSRDNQKLNHALQIAPVLREPEMFVKRTIEPLTIMIIAVLVGFSMLGAWLFFSAMALALHGNLSYEMERHGLLDMSDGIIEAQEQSRYKALMEEFARRMSGRVEQIAVEAQADPQMMERIEESNPSVADALAALNPNLRNIGGSGN